MNMSLDVTIFGFSRSQFLMIELKHQKERKKTAREESTRSRMTSESLIWETLWSSLQKTAHKHTNGFLEQIC